MNLRFLPLTVLLFALPHGLMAAPKVVFSPETAGWEKQVFPNGEKQQDVTFTTAPAGVEISVQEGGASKFPGVRIQPETPWNLSEFGKLEAYITNTTSKPMRVNIRVDDTAKETGSASAPIPPGETRPVTVYFDHTGKSKLKSGEIKSVIVFGVKAATAQTFRIDKLVADGVPGDKPPVDPNTVAVKPAKGVVFGDGVAIDGAKQIAPVGAGQAVVDGNAIQVTLPAKSGEGVTVKPVAGFWNLNDYFQVRVRVKNTGSAAITPSIRLLSKEGPTATTPAAAPIEPGAEAEIIVPFAATTPWIGPTDPDVGVPDKKKDFKGTPNTGTNFVSHRMTGVSILGDGTAGSLAVTSIAGENPTAIDLPDWLGQRPPVEGEWSKTFEDNFDGNSVDLTKWNIYGPNFWDKRTHFTKNNAIVKDGSLTLRVERKTGRHNDSPDGKVTDYATGFADTYGKWVQRYGYFEARVKLPTAPCLWPAFWLMPDRGLGNGDQGRRQSTSFGGGMEFDIIEQLSAWGPQRFNFAMHWDGYGKGHKATGSGSVYVPADKDGFITVGLLWTPGSAVLYGNGKEVARWDNPRVSDIPSCILLDNVTGGWETEALDDSQLPGDFVVDYVRVWQRSDLASDADGPKPNKGTPAAPTE